MSRVVIQSPAPELTQTQQRALNSLPPRVAEALSHFRDVLLARLGDQVRRVILYGSFARGEAHEESDVDVMVVVGWPFERLPDGKYRSPYSDPRRSAISDIALETTLKHGPFISAIVVDEALFLKGREAIREARREGIELYHHPSVSAFVREEIKPLRVLKETDSEIIYAIEPGDMEDIKRWLSHADRELEFARYAFKGGFYADLFSNVYYAMFYAAKAALLAVGVSVKSHEGAISEFGRVFGATGRVPGELSSMLSKRFEQRLDSDYKLDFDPSREEAEQAIRDAEVFIAKARVLAEEELNKRGSTLT